MKTGTPGARPLLEQLLQADGLPFVEQAYRLLFGRPADPEGAQYYLGLLQDGWSKWYVLGLLWRADERLRHAPSVPGLQEGLSRYARAQRRSLSGWYWRRVLGVDSDLPADRRLRALHQGVCAGAWAEGGLGLAAPTIAWAQAGWRQVQALQPGSNALAPQFAGQAFEAGVSLGAFCHTAAVLRRLDMRACSGPFDWVFMSPPAVLHALEDRFRTFLDPSQYEVVADADKVDPSANLCEHRFYREVYGVRFVFNHHNPTQAKDAQYFARCVSRFEAQLAAAAPSGSAEGGAGASLLLVMMTYEAVTPEQALALRRALGAAATGCFLLVLRLRVVRDPAVASRMTGAYLPVDTGPHHAVLDFCVRAPSDGLVFPYAEDNDALEHLLSAFKVRRHGRTTSQ